MLTVTQHQFLIQADFQLSASRQEIDGSCAWNETIRRSLPSAILKAVQQFNKGPTRFNWPRVLQQRPAMSDFFTETDRMTRDLLSSSPILRSHAGHWAKPADLFFVADEFRDGTGAPLLCYGNLGKDCLSREYSAEDIPTLCYLGVRIKTTEGFLTDLERFLSTRIQEFRRKPPDWHSALSRTLVSIRHKCASEHWDRVREMRLLPLRNGEWVAAITVGLYFFDGGGALPQIPAGVNLLEVDPASLQDEHRRSLVLTLRIESMSVGRVAKAISDLHADPSFDPNELTPADLASHALFLYYAGSGPARDQNLWFVAEDGSRGRGHNLYVRGTKQYAAHDWPVGFTRGIRFLHREYLVRFAGDEKELQSVTDWLDTSYNLRTFPRLVADDGESLHPDFRALIKLGPNRVLQLLKSQQRHYGTDRVPKSLVAEIGSMSVQCVGGVRAFLRDTILPTSGLPPCLFGDQHVRALQILDVPHRDDPDWRFLEQFGVAPTIHVRSLVRLLDSLGHADAISLEDASRVYFFMLHRSISEEDRITTR